MVCKNCGSVLKDKAKFCENCGAKVEEEVVDFNVKESEPVIERVEGEEIKPDNTASESVKVESDSVGNDPDFESVNLEKPKNGNIGVSIASMVCGILAIVCCCCSPLGVCCSIAAIVCGIISLKNDYDGRGMAIAGIVCGGFGAIVILFSLISSVAGLGSSLSGFDNFDFDSIDDFIESL